MTNLEQNKEKPHQGTTQPNCLKPNTYKEKNLKISQEKNKTKQNPYYIHHTWEQYEGRLTSHQKKWRPENTGMTSSKY